MTSDIGKLVFEAEDVVRRVGRGIEACICLSVSEHDGPELKAALAYVADNLRDDFAELVLFYGEAFKLTRG